MARHAFGVQKNESVAALAISLGEFLRVFSKLSGFQGQNWGSISIFRDRESDCFTNSALTAC